MSGSRRLLAGALAAFVLLGFAIDWWRRRSTPAAPPAPLPVSTGAALAVEPAFSPGGRWIVYASTRAGAVLDLWIQPAAGGTPRRLTSGDADSHAPTFSPDGARIAFRSEQGSGGVYVMPASGGIPVLAAPGGRDPRFSPDGRSLAYWFAGPDGKDEVRVVPASGGESRRICPTCTTARYPLWSTDGRHLLFSASDGRRYDLYTAPTAGGPPANTGISALMHIQGMRGDTVMPTAWNGGHVIVSAQVRGQVNVWRIALDPRLLQSTTAARQLTVGRGYEGPASAAGSTLVYSSTSVEPAAWVLTLDPRSGAARGEPERAAAGAGDRMQPAISADGRRIAFRRQGRLWVRDLACGAETALEPRDLANAVAVISPDGARVAYGADGNVYASPVSGGEPKLLGERTGQPWSWSPDGTRLLCQSWRRSLVLLYTANGERRDILRHPEANLSDARFSPDGRWIALCTGSSRGPRRVWIVPFREGPAPSSSEWIAVTGESGANGYPCWSADGRTLYYLSQRDGFRCIWAQRLEGATRRPQGEPFCVRHFHQRRFSLANPGNPSDAGLAAAPGKLVFTVFEASGGLWKLTVR